MLLSKLRMRLNAQSVLLDKVEMLSVLFSSTLILDGRKDDVDVCGPFAVGCKIYPKVFYKRRGSYVIPIRCFISVETV